MESTPPLYDYLIVGSGLFGATFAWRLRSLGKRVLVVEKREHLGGNVYCEEIEGIPVHKYGAHIFHTNSKRVWDFVNSLVEFNGYINSPLANYNGKLYNLPFNMNTFYQMWGVKTPAEAIQKIQEQQRDVISELKCEQPSNLEEQAKSLVGSDIYHILIKEYTEKQWGRPCSELPPFIIKRLPIRFTFDNNYFSDRYQGIPVGGYNKLISALLTGVECKIGVDFFQSEYRDWRSFAKKLIYTGPLDTYFDYRLGKLEWRTVAFATRIEKVSNFQGNAVINYTSKNVPYTRVIEHKHFEFPASKVDKIPVTVISEEYSAEYADGMEPYYPINDIRNNELAEQYRSLAKMEPDVIFGGRLGEYRYFDMAPVIEQVLNYDLNNA